MKRDYDDFEKIKTWFLAHNPFLVGDQLVCLDSGLIDEQKYVTCDQSEEIGEKIQKELDGKTYTNYSFKQKNQIKTLQSLYSCVNIRDENVTIDPLTLFLRLVVVVERKPENEVENYFHFELSPYPTSLFKGGVMRSAQKSKLKSFILNNVSPVEEPASTRIADGGALLWCCNWKKNELFSEIFQKYIDFSRHLKLEIIVFDGYLLSTKDSTHQKRSGKISQTVEINDLNQCPAERSTFLTNYKNKEGFVTCLASKLQTNGFEVICCPGDADTTIAKTALEIENAKHVTIYSDDTDVLCLLMHHVHARSQPHDIFLKTMTQKKATDLRVCYNIQNVIKTNDGTQKKIQMN